MKGEIELYNISFLILKVELHFNRAKTIRICPFYVKNVNLKLTIESFFK